MGRPVICPVVELTDDERGPILAGHFELTITHADDDLKRESCKALAIKLGSDPDGVFFSSL